MNYQQAEFRTIIVDDANETAKDQYGNAVELDHEGDLLSLGDNGFATVRVDGVPCVAMNYIPHETEIGILTIEAYPIDADEFEAINSYSQYRQSLID
jgi:hypothetical protein